MIVSRRLTSFLLLVLGAVGACTESSPCDSKSMLSGSSCVPSADAGREPPRDAVSEVQTVDTDADGARDGADDAVPASFFGKTCAADTECMGDTDYCAVQPGQAGYCTKTGCDKTPSVCPPRWTCFNLGMFQPGLPFMCRKPA